MGDIKPLDFINMLRESDRYIEAIYMNGGCYQFYKILKRLFPNAIPYKVRYPRDEYYSHIITKINDVYYDITGITNIKKYTAIDRVAVGDMEELEIWSFYKRNWLFRRCPNCDETVEGSFNAID